GRQDLCRLAGVRRGDDEGVLARGCREAVAPVDEDRDVKLLQARGREEIGPRRRSPHPGDDDQRRTLSWNRRLAAKRLRLAALGRKGGEDLRHTVRVAPREGGRAVEGPDRPSGVGARAPRGL